MAKVLVVDDDADVRLVLAGILRPVAEVVEAKDGEEALSLLAREKPGLMLLDLTMPGVGGLEVLERARSVAPGLLVVMLTGERDLATARAALDAGARAFITKPFDPEIVLAEVRRLIEDRPSPGGAPWRVAP